MTNPPIVAAAEIAVRKPIATQNSRSVRHHPVIRSVAMTAVAHPDRTPRTAAAIAPRGSRPGAAGGISSGRGRGM
jgi:hypothetical protein